MSTQKCPVSSFGIPKVNGEVAGIAGGIVEQLSAAEMRIAAKERNPGPIGAIGFLKACLISRLDFKVPEDYNHRCPIFCSAASQNNLNGEVWCAGRVKQSDWIISGKRVEFKQSCSKLQ
jgi:hypothetical protein